MIQLLKKYSIDCDTNAHFCDKIQYNEATPKEIAQYKMHVFICKLCKTHSALNTELSKACSRARLTTMPKTAKDDLKAKLEKEMNN